MSFETIDELTLLALSLILGLAHLIWGALAARRQQGLAWARGNRDEPKPVTGMAARLDRAFRNWYETWPIFAVAVLTAVAMERTGDLTFWGSVVYLVARTVYLPVYGFGLPLRSLIWFVSLGGLIAVIAGLFV